MSLFDELREFYHSQPNEVSLETQAVCNAACTFCPYTTLERIGTKMPDALIHRLIREMAEWEHPFYFSPFKVSDPLLDVRLYDILAEFNAKVPKGAVRLFTNGSALTDKHMDRIAKVERLAHLWVSLNTHRPVEYRELMGLDFERTAKNLDRLHERDFPHPVVVSRVGTDPDFAKYVGWRWPKFKVAMIKRDAWIDFTNASTDEVPNTPCGRWWELNITATGKAALCCMDGEGRFGFGDVNTQTLLEIYNHPTLKSWRDQMLSRQSVGSPCNGCTY
jgi:hypothetical protein